MIPEILERKCHVRQVHNSPLPESVGAPGDIIPYSIDRHGPEDSFALSTTREPECQSKVLALCSVIQKQMDGYQMEFSALSKYP